MKGKEPQPPERDQTIRQSILNLLKAGPHTSRDLSSLVGIREKEVSFHLEHIQLSLRNSDLVLKREYAQCLSCGFQFKKRTRFSKPSSCPRCRGQRIDPQVYWIESK